MTLSPSTRAAVLEVVRRLRDPMRDMRPERVGFDILWLSNMPPHVVLGELRAALGLSGPGCISDWARGKSREEVAAALESIATSEVTPQ